jgi:50S ribosomal protein L16 3-hydroxylase
LELKTTLDPQQFLDEYWQKKPVLIRGFIADFQDPLSAEELAGLACEAELESRLVCNPGEGLYALEHGPVPESRFDELGDANWTLLVQAVDQWVAEVAQLRRHFAFLPNWRIEDVMVSFAAPGGSVGPHFDQYDVFLLQGSGSRHWQVGPFCDASTPCRNENGLSLLQDFHSEYSARLEPGDVLYLPPGFSHWGVGLEPGLCFSIGLRAPSMAEMLEGFSNNLIDQADPGQRYTDSRAEVPTSSADAARIDPANLQDAFNKLLQAFDNKAEFNRYFGMQVSQPRYPEQILPPAEPLQAETLDDSLVQCSALLRHPASRFAWMQDEDGRGLLCFVDGEAWSLAASETAFVAELCDLSIENIKEITDRCATQDGRDLLLKLINSGSLVLE